jgi:hypothetical protein
MSTTTPIKGNNKQRTKNTQAFHKKYSRVFNFNFVVSKVWQNFPKTMVLIVQKFAPE